MCRPYYSFRFLSSTFHHRCYTELGFVESIRVERTRRLFFFFFFFSSFYYYRSADCTMQIVRSFNINFEWFKRINLVMQVGHVLHVQVTSLSPRWFIDFNFNELESSRWGLNFHSGRLVRSISYWSLLSCFNIKITFIASVESNSSCSYSDCVWKPQSNLIPVTLMEFNIGASSSTRATRRRRGGGRGEEEGGICFESFERNWIYSNISTENLDTRNQVPYSLQTPTEQ